MCICELPSKLGSTKVDTNGNLGDETPDQTIDVNNLCQDISSKSICPELVLRVSYHTEIVLKPLSLSILIEMNLEARSENICIIKLLCILRRP